MVDDGEAAFATEPSEALGAVKRRLFWSISAQLISIVARVTVQLVLVRILIRGWGSALYGDWLIIVSATAFLTMLDFGMAIYFGNALLIAWSRKQVRVYHRQLAVALGLYVSIISAAAVLLVLGIVFYPPPQWLVTHAMLPGQTLWTCVLLAAAVLVNMPNGVVNAVYRARGDFGLGIASNTIAETVRGLGVCTVALLGEPPATAAAVYLSVSALYLAGAGFHQYVRYRVFPYAGGVALPTAPEMREIATKSALYMVPAIANNLIQNAPIILLGWLASASGAVVIFSVYRTLTGFVRQIVLQLAHATGGEIGRQDSIGDHDGARRLVMHSARLTSACAGLLGGFTVVAARPFVPLWTHGQVLYDPWLIGVFLATIILTAPAQASFILFQYTNRPHALVLAFVGQALATVTLCLVMIGKFSALGAVIAVGTAEFLSVGIVLPYAAGRHIELPVVRYVGRSVLTGFLAFAAGFASAQLLTTVIPVHRIVDLTAFGLIWALVTAVPAFYLMFSGGMRVWLVQSVITHIPVFRQHRS